MPRFYVFHDSTTSFNFPLHLSASCVNSRKPCSFLVTDDLVFALELRRLTSFKCTTLKTETQGSYCLDRMPDSLLHKIHPVQETGAANVLVQIFLLHGNTYLLEGISTSASTQPDSNGKGAQLIGSGRQQGDRQTFTVPLNQVTTVKIVPERAITYQAVSLHQLSLPEVETAKRAWRSSKLGLLLLRRKLPNKIVNTIGKAVYFNTMETEDESAEEEKTFQALSLTT